MAGNRNIMCIQWLLSLFHKQPRLTGKGLAMATYRPADLDLLGADWFYVWGWRDDTDPRYIPMSREGIPLEGKAPPEYLLLYNEPNYREPWGATMPPQGAAWWCRAFEEMYPTTRIVIGNVSQHDYYDCGLDGVGWLTQFLDHYRALWGQPFSGILGCHLYCDDNLDYAEYEMQRYATLLDDWDGELWLTEFAMALNPANPEAFRKLCQMAAARFERIAVYTNEQDGSGSSLPYDMDLAPGGALSGIGEVYAGL